MKVQGLSKCKYASVYKPPMKVALQENLHTQKHQVERRGRSGVCYKNEITLVSNVISTQWWGIIPTIIHDNLPVIQTVLLEKSGGATYTETEHLEHRGRY